jgi:hypothetical protein
MFQAADRLRVLSFYVIAPLPPKWCNGCLHIVFKHNFLASYCDAASHACHRRVLHIETNVEVTYHAHFLRGDAYAASYCCDKSCLFLLDRRCMVRR